MSQPAKNLVARSGAAGLLCLVVAGCVPTLPARQLSVPEVPTFQRPPIEIQAASDVESATSLSDLIEIAARHHPDLQAARARVETARGRMIQDGLYPNPVFGPRFSDFGGSRHPLGQAGFLLSQQIVTAQKLQIARAAAAHGVEAADWQAITKFYDVVTRVRLAYFEYLTAQRERSTMQDIVRVSAEALQTAKDLEKAGAGNRPDVLRAKVEFEQNKLKKEVSQRRVEAALQNLWTALGRPTMKLEAIQSDSKELEVPAPGYDWRTMLDCLRERSSELQEARAVIAQQDKLLAKAQADVTPDVSATVIPYYNTPEREVWVQFFVTAPIPIFNRNQGNLHAARADLVRTRAQEHQLELLLTERLTLAFQRYQAAELQVESYRVNIVPEALESLKLVQAGYKAGDKKYDYTAVLQAQQVLFQAQLSYTQAMGELWRSVADIAGILQQDDLHKGCAATP